MPKCLNIFNFQFSTTFNHGDLPKYFTVIIALFFFSCLGNEHNSSKQIENVNTEKINIENKIVTPEFQSIIDSANIKGSILVYDLQKDIYHSNDFDWASKGNLPASTFKIPNSVIALETGVVENDSTLFKWDGEKRESQNESQEQIFFYATNMEPLEKFDMKLFPKMRKDITYEALKQMGVIK